MSQRGLTLIEVAAASLVLTVVLGAAAVALSSDSKAASVMMAPAGAELKVNAALERIATELRMAGEIGEDLDRDRELDPGEDANGNGVLDADWNLPDGAVDQPTLSFNRRIDLYDEDGNVTATGIYSRRITYLRQGTDFVREWEVTLPGGGVEVRRAVLARGVTGLRFSRTGQLVTVTVDVAIPAPLGGTRTLSTQVWLRN